MSTTPQPSKKDRRAEARAQREALERQEAERARRKRRLTMVGTILAVAVVAVVALVLIGSGNDEQEAGSGGVTQESSAAAMFDGIPQDGRQLGDPKAKVVLVEFADLQCPACKAFSEQVTPTVVKDYVKTGKVRMIFRNYAFLGPDSRVAAAMGAAAAQQDKLWPFTEVFYDQQGAENSGYVTDEFLRDVGTGAGLDVDAALKARNTQAIQQHLNEDATLAGRYGVNSTPSVFVGTDENDLRRVEWKKEGAASFTEALDKLLAKQGGK